jgi:hypothetical protein
MAFDIYDASISLLSTLAPLLARLRVADLKLEDQARRAATSVSLNIAEANQRVGKDRRNRFRISLAAPPRSPRRSTLRSRSAISPTATSRRRARSSIAYAR